VNEYPIKYSKERNKKEGKGKSIPSNELCEVVTQQQEKLLKFGRKRHIDFNDFRVKVTCTFN